MTAAQAHCRLVDDKSETDRESLPKVLVVDDNPKNLTSMAAVLEGMSLNLIQASSGDEAIRQVLAHDIALILLDVVMPGMDGFETARLIHGCNKGKRIPIIFHTATYHDDSHRLNGYAEGCVDYLLKPVVPEIMRAKVGVFLSLFQRTQELQDENLARKQAEEALRQNFAVLDRFNRLAVGRELRMVELKREVNELARALGKPEPYDVSFVEQVRM